MFTFRSAFFLLAAAALPAIAAAQRPEIRQLGPVTASTSEVLTATNHVRALGDGSVLVNDVPSRRVLLFDPTLSRVTVVADSTSATGSAYSGRIGSLIPYRGDSTLFVDPASMSMLVVDPAGKLARVMSVPRSEDAMALAVGTFGTPGFDGAGRLVYRPSPQFPMMAQAMGPGGRGGAGMPEIPTPPDSAPIMRVDLATRHTDTLGFVRTPRMSFQVTRDENNRVRVMTELNPLPVVDEWVVLPDGAVAFVRGRDYRVDYIEPDGSRGVSTKIPFEWQRLSDEDKEAFMDSVKVARERMQESAGGGPAAGNAGPGGGAAERVTGPGGETIVFRGGGGGPGGGGPGGGPGGAQRGIGGGGAMGGGMQISFVSPDKLPDYKPAFFAGAVRADREGNLWVRTIPTQAIPGGPVYDVINRQGELVERVQIPEGREIVGFGPGVVFMSVRTESGVKLERAGVR